MLNIIDVFSGAGGLTEGFRGEEHYKFICHIEMDKAACDSLALRNIYYYLKNSNNLSLYSKYIKGEITKADLFLAVPNIVTEDILNIEIKKENLPTIFDFIDKRIENKAVDGIIGGPPCQAYSTIGRANNKAKKYTDKRIYLYKYYIDLLLRYNPKFFVFENVKGLLSFKDLENEYLLPKIIKEFNEIGYKVDYKIVNAYDYGVSQKRERLILIGYKDDLAVEGNFFDYLSDYKESPPLLKHLFCDLPKIMAGDESDRYSYNTRRQYINKYIRSKGDILTQHIARPHNSNDLQIYRFVLQAKNNGRDLKYNDIPLKLQTHSNTTAFLDRFKALDYNSVSHTIVAHIAKDGHYYIHPDIEQNRSISVREAARIQGFPDSFYFESSRTSAFRQIGNAVPPILAGKIAAAIIDFLDS